MSIDCYLDEDVCLIELTANGTHRHISQVQLAPIVDICIPVQIYSWYNVTSFGV